MDSRRRKLRLASRRRSAMAYRREFEIGSFRDDVQDRRRRASNKQLQTAVRGAKEKKSRDRHRASTPPTLESSARSFADGCGNGVSALFAFLIFLVR